MSRSQPVLSPEQEAHWSANGWLLLRAALPTRISDSTRAAVEEVTRWAHEADRGGSAPGLHHWELTDQGPALARSEDLVPYHHQLRALICDGLLLDLASSLLGEQAVLFKEKINYKQPGGAGFAPHQDATAYRFVDHHVSCMLPIDSATVESGCLAIVSGCHQGFLPTDEGGRIRSDVADDLEWEMVEVRPGDLLWFDSYTPHRSGTNQSSRPRRALYLTYNAASAGDHRAAYYADKRAEFAAQGDNFGDERVRLSISDDFLGRPVPRISNDGVSSR